MRILPKIIQINNTDTSKNLISVLFSIRLNIVFKYKDKITLYKKQVIKEKFPLFSFKENNFTFVHSKFIDVFYDVYKSHQRLNLINKEDGSLCSSATNEIISILKEYAKKELTSLTDKEITVAYEDVCLLVINKVKYAMPTAINLYVDDPNGRRSVITSILHEI